jgi:hypothetical protein
LKVAQVPAKLGNLFLKVFDLSVNLQIQTAVWAKCGARLGLAFWANHRSTKKVQFPGCALLQGTSEGTHFPILTYVMHKSRDLGEPIEALFCIHSRKLGMAIEIFRPKFRPDSPINCKRTIL